MLLVLAPVDPVEAFRGAVVAFGQLRAGRALAQRDTVAFQDVAFVEEQQFSLGLEHQDLVHLAFQARRGIGLGQTGEGQAQQSKQPAHGSEIPDVPLSRNGGGVRVFGVQSFL
ncbi:hypothetical protein [Pseudomonas aeruginosa]|uniref:hypothetical protein n=1 Tax=Pseudomonas aeruginosa TaxID=287 RepID=UPI003748E125